MRKALSAFTMAEILLSLTIIGVVAAITLPSLTGNINERTWNTQRKALYARFSQAIALMPALNGYGTLTEATSSASAVDTAAETFVTDGLSKVLKINNICDSEHLPDCGIPAKITPLDAASQLDIPLKLSDLNADLRSTMQPGLGSFSQIDTKAAAFETANGESIVVYYSPVCHSDMKASNWYLVGDKVCANFIYDLNGTKGPNTVGKDVGFISVIYPSDSSVVMPIPYNQPKLGLKWVDAGKYCHSFDDNARLPNLEELIALYANRKLVGGKAGESLGTSGINIWSSRIVDYSPTHAYYLYFGTGTVNIKNRTDTAAAQCVRRN